jgi:hypothetical protein
MLVTKFDPLGEQHHRYEYKGGNQKAALDIHQGVVSGEVDARQAQFVCGGTGS